MAPSQSLTVSKYAAAFCPVLIEPLVQLGLGFLDPGPGNTQSLPCDYYRMTLEQHLNPSSDPGSRLAIGTHRCMLSHGIYDDISIPPNAPAMGGIEELAFSLMAGSVELFNLLYTQVFPDFYQWPLGKRISQLTRLGFVSVYDRKAVGQFFHPDGHYRSEHVQCIIWTGETVLQRFTSIYFHSKPYLDRKVDVGLRSNLDHQADWQWNQLRLVIRDMASVADIGDLSPKDRRTTLVEGILATRVVLGFANSERVTRRWPWKRHLRECVKPWLEDILEAGHNLEAYGEAEMLAFHHQVLSPRLWAWPPQAWNTRGSSEGPYRWKGFKYGPRPEDWDLIWELDPAVEEFVADFWAWVENPPLAIPGAWVDDEEDY